MEKYVIFDVDGTLNQTALYALPAYRDALQKRGKQVEDAEIVSCFGLSPSAIVEKLFGSMTEEELKAWRKDIEDYEFNLMESVAAPFPHMEETLQILREKGYRTAICSNAFPEHIEHVLKAIKLEKYFQVIGSLELGTSKAEVLEVLLKNLQCEKACMVGDRKFDIEAARHCQIPVIGCKYGYAPEEAAMADCVVSDPIEIVDAVEKLL